MKTALSTWYDRYIKKSDPKIHMRKRSMDSDILRTIKEEDMHHDDEMHSLEGAVGELTSLTMCEEIEGLLKINMNKVNDESQLKKPYLLGEEKVMLAQPGKSRQEIGGFS